MLNNTVRFTSWFVVVVILFKVFPLIIFSAVLAALLTWKSLRDRISQTIEVLAEKSDDIIDKDYQIEAISEPPIEEEDTQPVRPARNS